MKTKNSILIMAFGMVTSDNKVMSPFIYLHDRQQFLEELVLIWFEWVTARRPYVWKKDSILSHKQENPILAVRKFLQPHHPQTSGCLTPHISVLVERETNTRMN